MQRENRQPMSSPCIWDKIWTDTEDDEGFWWCVRHESEGLRGRRVISYIEKHLGNISGLRVIEVGSGGGVYSFILAKYGASVTLLDYSQKALSLAQKHLGFVGFPASFVCADALNLEPNLLEKFDVAMSFGTIEHFQYPKKFLIAKAHLDLLRPGGVVIISVPNRWFFLHEILKFYLQRRGKWQLGHERAFTRQELFRLGNRMGLENVEVGGSAFITDMFRYLCIFQGTRLFRRFFQVRFKRAPIADSSSPFDNLLGADIFLMGRKPS